MTSPNGFDAIRQQNTLVVWLVIEVMIDVPTSA
jgi:hypothetical protein